MNKPGFHVYQDTKNEYRWSFRADNYEVIAVSSEGYKNKQDCVNAVLLVMDTTRKTPYYDHTK
ncbi:MAG: DUF1508 domain-containing protein [Armatimonadetes bacterium]|nr:DUF1508 domain-containing protein [Armatimonadota bacterium]